MVGDFYGLAKTQGVLFSNDQTTFPVRLCLILLNQCIAGK